ncbi:nuclear transport factor 2 family protein [Streptomyces hokutonensis]|uniref:nuclear transport factor 2 family protein n=1 Tax=Streptomyces hokutonensis TaxID=1306990 RepID=UPI00036770E7|nr:nuclear transport factor 2 family protein [Streptomyces hokutonensis]
MPPHSPRSIAADLRDALHSADPRLLEALLHPQVLWVNAGPGEPQRQGRAGVLRWHQDRYDQGVRVHAEEIFTFPAAIVLALRVADPGIAVNTDELPALYYRVFHLFHDQVIRIRDYTERTSALAAAHGSAAPSL